MIYSRLSRSLSTTSLHLAVIISAYNKALQTALEVVSRNSRPNPHERRLSQLDGQVLFLHL